MHIHGTPQAYQDIYGLNKDQVESYPPLSDKSDKSSKAENSKVESTNKNNLPSLGDEGNKVAGSQSQRIRDERGKFPVIKIVESEREKRKRK